VITTIARFIARPSKKGSEQPDVGLMVFMRSNTELKANRVYEIRDVLGELSIVDVGECGVGPEGIASSHDQLRDVCWGNEVGHVLDVGRHCAFMTREELDEQAKQNRRED